MLLRTLLIVILGIVNIVLCYRMMWGDSGLLAFLDLREQYESLTQKVAQLDVANVKLSKEIRLLKSDEAYLEKMIRKRLHYVRENEILYLFTDSLPTNKSGAEHDSGKN